MAAVHRPCQRVVNGAVCVRWTARFGRAGQAAPRIVSNSGDEFGLMRLLPLASRSNADRRAPLAIAFAAILTACFGVYVGWSWGLSRERARPALDLAVLLAFAAGCFGLAWLAAGCVAAIALPRPISAATRRDCGGRKRCCRTPSTTSAKASAFSIHAAD